MYLIKIETVEQERVEFSDTSCNVKVTYYADRDRKLIIRGTDSCITFVCDEDKRKKIGEYLDEVIGERNLPEVRLTKPQYDELLERYKALKSPFDDLKVIKPIHDGMVSMVQEATDYASLSLSAILSPQKPVSEKELQEAEKDLSGFMIPK